MPNLLQKIFNGKELTDSIGNAIDQLSTSDEEKLQAKTAISEVVMQQINKALELQQSIILSETQGSALQRNWRPILMLAFGFVVMYRHFISPVVGLPSIEMPDQFWNLLEIGIGGYVIGRSVEKVADTVVKNVDISFIKKKNR